jgi:hypothetical protein
MLIATTSAERRCRRCPPDNPIILPQMRSVWQASGADGRRRSPLSARPRPHLRRRRSAPGWACPRTPPVGLLTTLSAAPPAATLRIADHRQIAMPSAKSTGLPTLWARPACLLPVFPLGVGFALFKLQFESCFQPRRGDPPNLLAQRTLLHVDVFLLETATRCRLDRTTPITVLILARRTGEAIRRNATARRIDEGRIHERSGCLGSSSFPDCSSPLSAANRPFGRPGHAGKDLFAGEEAAASATRTPEHPVKARPRSDASCPPRAGRSFPLSMGLWRANP